MAFGIDDAIAAGLKVIDKFVPDPAAKAKAEAELRADLLASDKAQMEVNKAEAQTGSLFIGGWRPAIGWVLAAAVAYTYLLVPIGMWIAFVVGKPISKPPVLDANLWELMFAMLGLGGLRTFEKIKGVASK
jgi:roadblock/LC7 domain-containing protein